MVKGAIVKFLGINNLQEQINNLVNRIDATDSKANDLDQRIATLELQVENIVLQTEATLREFGNFKNRTPEELKLMAKLIKNLLGSVDALVKRIENEAGAERAENLLKPLKNKKKQLKNNLARIHNAQGG